LTLRIGTRYPARCHARDHAGAEIEERTAAASAHVRRGAAGNGQSGLLGLDGIIISLGDILPIDNVEDRFQVIWAHVLVLQVISVFPHVETEQRHVAGQRVLVGQRHHL